MCRIQAAGRCKQSVAGCTGCDPADVAHRGGDGILDA
jgi:hypothetical protein